MVFLSSISIFYIIITIGTVEMRHFAIRATPVGISKSVKRVLQLKVPNLGELEVY